MMSLARLQARLHCFRLQRRHQQTQIRLTLPLLPSDRLIPGGKVKNREERLVVLNRIARSVIDGVRGMHPEYVFVHKPVRRRAHDREAGVELNPIERMNNTAWRNARERAANKWGDLDRATGADGFSASSGPRLEAHLRAAATRCRCVVRRSSGPARPQEWAHHNALLVRRTCEPHRCGGARLRRKLPQISRKHLVTASSGLEKWAATR
jgi:hypothetical protein